MSKLTNEEKAKRYNIRKILRIVTILLAITTIVLAILSLTIRLLFVYPLITYILAVITQYIRNRLDYRDIDTKVEKQKEADKEIEKKETTKKSK